MTWLDGRAENSGHLLAALHPPFALVLWDTASGTMVWRKAYTETLQGFDLDPFDPARVAFRCLECVLFVEDFHHSRAPQSAGRKFYVNGPVARGSPVRGADGMAVTPGGGGAEDKGRAARTRIKKLMKELVMGEHSSSGEGDAFALSECLQVREN